MGDDVPLGCAPTHNDGMGLDVYVLCRADAGRKA